MAKNRAHNANPKRPAQSADKPARQSAAAHGAGSTIPSLSPLSLVLGVVFMLVAVAASLMLVLKHVFGMEVPGCSAGGACAEAANALVPYVKIPVASLGLAYYLTVLTGWIASRGAPPNAFRWLVRLGVVGSIGFLIAIVIGKHFCPYCLAAHAGILAFWIAVETSRASTDPLTSARWVMPATAVFAVGVAALGIVEWQQRDRIAAREAAELAKSQRQIIDRPAPPTQPATTNITAANNTTKPDSTSQSSTTSTSALLAGRWHHGPDIAPVRITIFSDFQCSDCRNIEMQLRTMLAKYPNKISVTAKHFPFHPDCNPNIKNAMHKNACWAARASEAAGRIKGNEGFWQMHDWLFDRGGGFENPEFDAGMKLLGYTAQEQAEMVRLMNDPATDIPIKKDIEDAVSLGLYFTPLIFVNGVELRGFRTPNALVSTIDALMATNPPAQGPEVDQPPLALQKHIDDWRLYTVLQVPGFSRQWPLGVADASKARVRVLLFGDLQDVATGELDALIRPIVAKRADVHYRFQHFPFDQSCNIVAVKTQNALACRMARAAEAAGRLGGAGAYWKMVGWLTANRDPYKTVEGAPAEQVQAAARRFEADLREAAKSQALDVDAFLAMMDSQPVTASLNEDTVVAKALGFRTLPTLLINERMVLRWTLEGENLLEKIIDEASKTN